MRSWSDEDVIDCGKWVASGLNVFEVENLFGVPNSTVHWVIMHRLPRLDLDLFDACIESFCIHKKQRGRYRDRTT